MVLNSAAERIAALGYAYGDQPKEDVVACNLCGGERLVVLTHRDRYGFPATSRACLRCGLVFLAPRMTAEAYGRFYDDVYRPLVSAYHGRQIDAETVEADQHPYAERLAAFLEPFAGATTRGTILDIGGSTGVVSEHIAQRLDMNAVVLDPAPAEVERARARGLEATVGTIEDWDGAGQRFEFVLLCQTIDHLLDVSGALARLRSLLADDGFLFVDVVDFRAAYSHRRSVEDATKIDHPYSLTESTAEAFLARAGFELIRKDYAPDHLHVGYLCKPTEPDPDALPGHEAVARFFDDVRRVQTSPRT